LGVVVGTEALRRNPAQVKSYTLLDEFKDLSQIRPLVRGGTTIEYSAHAIAEGGYSKVPPLLGEGYLLVGDAAGLSLNALFTVRGMDFAIASGYYAARAVADAKAAGDLSAAGLSRYEASLRASFVLKDLQTARDTPHLMENPRLFTHYPQAINRLLEEVFTVGSTPQPRVSSLVTKRVRRDFLDLKTLKELYELRKM
jgi:electron transfer flavoprotein-quinone oxidoreductase